MERDHQAYLGISDGKFAGLSTSGDILLPCAWDTAGTVPWTRRTGGDSRPL